VAIGQEITNLAGKLEPQRTYGGEYGFLSNSPLVLKDPQGKRIPLLASALPSRDDGTWVVNSDGTMRTTWRIRDNARWHDGQPVVSQDFVFAGRVYADPLIPMREREPERFVSSVEPLDAKTFVMHWSQPYPWADELITRQFEALPEHAIGALFDAGDREAFLNSAFWTSTQYVGNGPYKLVTWDPGSQLVYRAFDDYFMGRAKIDEIIIRIIPDPNTQVASLLSGAIDGTLGITLGQQQALTVRKQWEQSDGGQVVIMPARFQFVQIQFDPVKNGQPALFDPRVRRALVHGIDRETMAQVLSEGTAGAADVMMSPNDPQYPRVDAAIAKSPYDIQRSAALLQEAGWTRRGEAFVDSSGQPFNVSLWNTSGADNERQGNIIAANLGQVGVHVDLNIVPTSRISDTEYRTSFPGLNITAGPTDIPQTMNVGHSDQCAVAERRWVGTNRGCWKNAEYDRNYLIASTSLDPAERANAVVSALKIMTEEVGIFGLMYTTEAIAARKGLVGPGLRWPPQVGTTWNVHEWHWQ
jgi:peptide/nickel transport system substrate-binding protein